MAALLPFDIVNALFELFGMSITLLSVRRLYIDKEIKGVSAWPSIFFTSWSGWNLFYYYHLHQYFSAMASLPIANVWWIALFIRYRKNDN